MDSKLRETFTNHRLLVASSLCTTGAGLLLYGYLEMSAGDEAHVPVMPVAGCHISEVLPAESADCPAYRNQLSEYQDQNELPKAVQTIVQEAGMLALIFGAAAFPVDSLQRNVQNRVVVYQANQIRKGKA